MGLPSGADGENLLPQLGDAHESIRYMGGARFHGDAGGAEWGPFGRSYWMLPRAEIAVQPLVSAPSGGSTEGSEALGSGEAMVLGSAQREPEMTEMLTLRDWVLANMGWEVKLQGEAALMAKI
eukprot:g14961.t1